jgi:hypothetical protein
MATIRILTDTGTRITQEVDHERLGEYKTAWADNAQDPGRTVSFEHEGSWLLIPVSRVVALQFIPDDPDEPVVDLPPVSGTITGNVS